MGNGKSRLALQMAAGIASGGDEGRWIGGQEAPRLGNAIDDDGAPVLFCSWEDDRHEQSRRLSMLSGSPAPWVTPERTGKLRLVSLIGAGPAWGVEYGRHISTVGQLQELGERIQLTAEQEGVKLVVLDSLAACFLGNENDRGTVRAFLSEWHKWAEDNGTAVLLIAHESQTSTVSGSTDWTAGPRSLLTFTYVKTCEHKPTAPCKADCPPPAVKLEHAKANYSAKWPALRLKPGTLRAGGGGLRWRVRGEWDRPTDDAHGDDEDGAPPIG